MSANLGTPSPAAAPPPDSASSVAAPDSGSVESTAAPAVVEPAAPPPDAAANAVPGASTPEPKAPLTMQQVLDKYHAQVAGMQEGEGETQPPVAKPAEVEAKPAEEAAPKEEEPEAPLEAAPETDEAEAEPVVEAAPAPVETVSDEADLENFLTSEELIEARFPRQLSKKVKAEIERREAHRSELHQSVQNLGGKVGLGIATNLNKILLKENPTEEDVEALFDQIVLPENAHAVDLFKLMGEHLINTEIQHEVAGPALGTRLISEHWGTNPDGTPAKYIGGENAAGESLAGKPYDFGGMAPLELVDTLIRAHQAGVLNLDFIKGELEGVEKPAAPSPRELELQRQVEELTAGKESEKAESERKVAEAKQVYKTQATGFVSRFIMKPVMPLAVSANWAAIDGEKGPQVERKQVLGEIVANHINKHIMGTAEAPAADYAEVQKMIDENRAFDAAGHPTPRFLLKMEPLQTKAKAEFHRLLRILGPEFKFKAETSRNAQLAKQNGSGKQRATTEDAPPPLIEATPPVDSGTPKTTEQLIAEKVENFRRQLRAEEEQQRVGQL